MTLLSLTLFDHCSLDSPFTTDRSLNEELSVPSTINVNPSTGLPIMDGSIVDVSATPFGATDTDYDSVIKDNFSIEAPTSDDYLNDICCQTDDATCGFMLNDEGGISTSDESHGATDWFDGEMDISDNCDY